MPREQAFKRYFAKDILSLLERAPKVNINKRENINLRYDATYFKQFCLLCYQDDFDGHIQLIRFSDGEHFEEIKEDLGNLIKLGLKLESITTDGHKSVLKAIENQSPKSLSNGALSTFNKCVCFG